MFSNFKTKIQDAAKEIERQSKIRTLSTQFENEDENGISTEEKLNFLLQERSKLDALLKEITPLDGLSDFDSFESHLRSLIDQKKAASDEVKRLTGQKKDGSGLILKIGELESTVKKYNEKLSKMMEKAKSLQEENQKMKQIRQENDKSVEIVVDENFQKMKEKLEKVESEWVQKEFEYQKQLEMLKNVVTEQGVQKTELEAMLATKTKELEILQKENDKTQVKEEDCEAVEVLKEKDLQIQTLGEELQKLRVEFEATKNSFNEQKSEKEASEKELLLARNTIETLEKDVKSRENILEETEWELGSIKDENGRLKEVISQGTVTEHAELKKLENVIEEMKIREHTLNLQLDEGKKSSISLQEELEKISAGQLKLQNELEATKQEKEHLAEENEKNTKEQYRIKIALEDSIRAREKLVESVETLKETIIKLETELENSEKEKIQPNDFASKLQSAEAEILELKQSLDIARIENTELKTSLIILNQDRDDLNQKTIDLEQKCEENRTKMERSIDLLKQSKAQVMKLQGDYTNIASQLSEVSAQKADLESQIESSKNIAVESDSLKKQLLDFQNLLKAKTVEFENIERQFLNEKDSLKAAQEELATTRYNATKNEKALEESMIQLQTFREKVYILEQELEMSKRLFESRSAEYSLLRTRMTEMESKVEYFQENARIMTNENEDRLHQLMAENDNYQKKVKEVDVQNNELKCALESKSSQLYLLEGQLADIKKEKVDVETKLQNFEWKMAETQEEVADLSKRLGETKVENEKLKIRAKANHKNQEEYQIKIQDLQATIDNFKTIEDKLTLEVDKLRNQQNIPRERSSRASSIDQQQSIKFPEEINREYIKNVVWKFITDFNHREQLVPVLAAIFKFSRDEQAKIMKSLSPRILDTLPSPLKQFGLPSSSS